MRRERVVSTGLSTIKIIASGWSKSCPTSLPPEPTLYLQCPETLICNQTTELNLNQSGFQSHIHIQTISELGQVYNFLVVYPQSRRLTLTSQCICVSESLGRNALLSCAFDK